MAQKKKSIRRLKRWAAADLKMLKASARKKSVAEIARTLKRSPAAVRYQAWVQRVSLGLRKK